MKTLKLIITVYCILIPSHAANNAGPPYPSGNLTPEENEERLKNCEPKDPVKNRAWQFGYHLSHRHSSTSNTMWLDNQFRREDCEDGDFGKDVLSMVDPHVRNMSGIVKATFIGYCGEAQPLGLVLYESNQYAEHYACYSEFKHVQRNYDDLVCEYSGICPLGFQKPPTYVTGPAPPTHVAVSGGNLTPEENEERLKNCEPKDFLKNRLAYGFFLSMRHAYNTETKFLDKLYSKEDCRVGRKDILALIPPEMVKDWHIVKATFIGPCIEEPHGVMQPQGLILYEFDYSTEHYACVEQFYTGRYADEICEYSGICPPGNGGSPTFGPIPPTYVTAPGPVPPTYVTAPIFTKDGPIPPTYVTAPGPVPPTYVTAPIFTKDGPVPPTYVTAPGPESVETTTCITVAPTYVPAPTRDGPVPPIYVTVPNEDSTTTVGNTEGDFTTTATTTEEVTTEATTPISSSETTEPEATTTTEEPTTTTKDPNFGATIVIPRGSGRSSTEATTTANVESTSERAGTSSEPTTSSESTTGSSSSPIMTSQGQESTTAPYEDTTVSTTGGVGTTLESTSSDSTTTSKEQKSTTTSVESSTIFILDGTTESSTFTSESSTNTKDTTTESSSSSTGSEEGSTIVLPGGSGFTGLSASTTESSTSTRAEPTKASEETTTSSISTTGESTTTSSGIESTITETSTVSSIMSSLSTEEASTTAESTVGSTAELTSTVPEGLGYTDSTITSGGTSQGTTGNYDSSTDYSEESSTTEDGNPATSIVPIVVTDDGSEQSTSTEGTSPELSTSTALPEKTTTSESVTGDGSDMTTTKDTTPEISTLEGHSEEPTTEAAEESTEAPIKSSRPDLSTVPSSTTSPNSTEFVCDEHHFCADPEMMALISLTPSSIELNSVFLMTAVVMMAI